MARNNKEKQKRKSKKGPPFEPDENVPAKPDENPDPTLPGDGEEEPDKQNDPTKKNDPKKNDPTRITPQKKAGDHTQKSRTNFESHE